MNNFWKFATPQYLKAGKSSGIKLASYLKEFNIARPFLVVDPILIKKNRFAREVIGKFSDYDFKLFSAFSTNPTTKQVKNAVAAYIKFQPNSVVVIGGGSAIDLAKATMLVSLNGGRIEDYLAGKSGDKKFPPFIVLPTTCGTGSEASSYAVIMDKKLKKKRGIENYNFLPTLVIMDPLFLHSLNKNIIAATAMDALAHLIESFISKKANEITRSSVRGLLINIIPNIENASFKKDDKAFSNMLNTAFSLRLLYPRTGLSITHALSHPLGAQTNIHHGLAVSFFIPISFKFNYNFCRAEMKEVLSLMGFDNLDQFEFWFTNFCRKSGIMRSIKKMLSRNDLPLAAIAKDAMRSSNIASNPRTVTENGLKNVLQDSILYWKNNEK